MRAERQTDGLAGRGGGHGGEVLEGRRSGGGGMGVGGGGGLSFS